MSYIIIILLSNIVIILANALSMSEQTVAIISRLAAASTVSTLAVIAVDGVTAFLVRRLPEKLFSPPQMMMRVSKRERLFYQKIGIKRWKKHVPELGGFTGFHKDHLEEAGNATYLARFLMESNYGVAIHFANIACGFGILFLPIFPLAVTLPVALVNAVLTGAPIAILRYNTPGTQWLYEKAKRKQDGV